MIFRTDSIISDCSLFNNSSVPPKQSSQRSQILQLHSLKEANELAEILVKCAFSKVDDKIRNTPYARKYKKEYNASWTGGKIDDITAVVTYVKVNDI